MNSKITRRSFGRLIAGATLGGQALFGAAPASPASSVPDSSGAAIFPYGTHVYREPHLPLEQLRRISPS
jgi:hypothetical protein